MKDEKRQKIAKTVTRIFEGLEEEMKLLHKEVLLQKDEKSRNKNI